MATNSSTFGHLLTSKFRGCLVGALVGDCLGAPFEGEGIVSKSVLSGYFKRILADDPKKGNVLVHRYTDDTAMTRVVAESLIANKQFNAKDMAQRITKEYYSQPKRGYGWNVVDVFKALRESEFEDVYGPARRQFGGAGSYGNGGAMRMAPVALFCYHNEDKLIELARKCALITHAHRDGYNGAILQCLALHQVLTANPQSQLCPLKYLDALISKIEEIEKVSADKIVDQRSEAFAYTGQLKKMREVMQSEDPVLSSEETVVLFGNRVSALYSVPTAIYAFLRGLRQTTDFQSDNPFLRTLYFAISLGGDTDTIASMAASIAGAYAGIEAIPENVQTRCEDLETVVTLADQMASVIQT